MKQFEVTKIGSMPTPEEAAQYRREIQKILDQIEPGEVVLINGDKCSKFNSPDSTVKDAYGRFGNAGFLADYGVSTPEELPDEPYSHLQNVSEIERDQQHLEDLRARFELVDSMEVGEVREIDGQKMKKRDTGYTIRQFFSHSTEDKGPGPGWDRHFSVLKVFGVKEVHELPDEPYCELEPA